MDGASTSAELEEEAIDLNETTNNSKKNFRKRKYGQNLVDKEIELKANLQKPKQWRKDEKERLLNALKKYGFGGLEYVAKEVGTRSLNETIHFCEIRKSRLPKNDKRIAKNSNLSVWKRKIFESIDPRIKAPANCKHSLAEAMDSAKVECKKLSLPSSSTRSAEGIILLENKYPEFSTIYDYLKALILKQIPVPLGPTESFLILHLMNDLLEILKTNKLDHEKEFLSILPLRPLISPQPEYNMFQESPMNKLNENIDNNNKQNLTNEDADAPSTSGTQNSSTKFKSNSKNVETSDDVNNNSGEETDDAPEINEYEKVTENPIAAKYPKIDLINHTQRYLIGELNPLQVPIDIIKEETKLVNDHFEKREKQKNKRD